MSTAMLPELSLFPEPSVVLVASDLHLGAPAVGARSVAARADRLPCEADAAFTRWLAFHDDDAMDGALLVLNGDTFDFLRVVSCPTDDGDFVAWARMLPESMRARATPSSISAEERRFGLRTDACKSVWKLRVIALAHAKVFDAMARWVGFGGRLLFVKGNHDLELHWKEVCESIREEIAQRVHSGWGHAGRSRDRILFSEDGIRLGNVCIEHGHRWETITAVAGSPTIGEQRRELRLPPGAIVGRYMLNPMECPGGSGTVALAGSLLVALLILLAGVGLDGAPAAIPFLLISGVAGKVAWPKLLELLHSAGERIVTRMSVADVRAGAHEVLQGLRGAAVAGDFTYAVMGHTHVPEVCQMDSGAQRGGAWYVNTGTWSPGWAPAARRVRAQSVYRFVRFTLRGTGRYSLETLEWDDEIQLPTWSGDQPEPPPTLHWMERSGSDYQVAEHR